MIKHINRDSLVDTALQELTGNKPLEEIKSMNDINRVIFVGLDGSGKSYLCANLVARLNTNITDPDKQIKYLHSGPIQSMLFSIRDPNYMSQLKEARVFDRHPLTDFVVYKVASEYFDRDFEDVKMAIDLVYYLNYFYEIKYYDAIFILLNDKFIGQTVQPDYVKRADVRECIIKAYLYVAEKLNILRPDMNIYIIQE